MHASEFGRDEAPAWTRLVGVPERVSSSRFVGRRAELTRLEETWKTAVADEQAGVVLIAGEAGVGKSRLVNEFIARVSEPALVLTGQCFDLADRALPFGPIVQVLRTLHRTLDDATLEAVVGPGREELGALLPELHAPVHEGIVAGALFEQLLGVFERLAEYMPILVVIEDLHWADRSTRELFAYLAGSLHRAAMVLLGTYRSDDLHRRHPLRTLIAELDRAGSVERIDLDRFDRDEVRELVTAICGVEPSADLVDRTYLRSDGNAFFAEELLAVEGEHGTALPPTLREIVLARVDGLSEAAQQVLRCAAVIGRSADHRLLEAAAGLTHDELALGAREAVAAHILVTESEGLDYRFRHALVREAVEEDLLPGDRVALHSRVAEVLTRHPDLFDGGDAQLYAQLACHWDSARNAPRALVAALDAARAAEHIYAYGDALEHTEQILTLWDQVADATELTGMGHVEMLRYAARQAEMSGSTDRALDYIRAALTEVDPAVDPVGAALLHERWGYYLFTLSRGWDEIIDHCREAVRLVPDAPSPERAKVLATLGQQLMLAGQSEEAISVCRRAIDVARQVGEIVTEGHARNSLGSALGSIGRSDEGLAELHEARRLAIETRSWGDICRAAVNEGSALLNLARVEDAVAITMEGAEIARAHGLDRAVGSFLRLNTSEGLYLLGRWDEAEEQIRDVESLDPIGMHESRIAEQHCLLAVGRGDFERARFHAERMAALMIAARNERDRQSLEYASIAIASWSGHEAEALALAVASTRQPVEDPATCSDLSVDVVIEGLAAGATAVLRARDEAERARHLEQVDEIGALLDRWIADRRWDGGRPGALDTLLRLVAAEVARARRTDDPREWLAIADIWADHSMRPREAYAHWRAAEAFVRGDDRDAAAAAARDAYTAADSIGWLPLRDGVAGLARRARLDLGTSVRTVASPADRFGLTAREVEVLALLAEGRTNRQIADALFISAKTASVHVSNILAKLGVSNRGEAAAAARRLGI